MPLKQTKKSWPLKLNNFLHEVSLRSLISSWNNSSLYLLILKESINYVSIRRRDNIIISNPRQKVDAKALREKYHNLQPSNKSTGDFHNNKTVRDFMDSLYHFNKNTEDM
jgi:hypothetical protein